MRRFLTWAVAVAAVLIVAGALPADAATKPPSTAISYGDSLVWESLWSVKQALATNTKWVWTDRSASSTAPCDWLAQLDSDLSTMHPNTVTFATAANSQTACMVDPDTGQPWPVGSAGSLARYRTDLETLIAHATAAGARVTFVEDPPFANAPRDAAEKTILADVQELATRYHGVAIVTTAHRQLAGKHDAWVLDKKCLKGETAAQGCTNGQIQIRDTDGLHLCSGDLDLFYAGCSQYSSGEYRYGLVLAKAITHPPAPVLP